MDSFDDFLRSELSRLDEYGLAQSAALAASAGVARLASRFSTRAKGTVNLKDKVKEIVTAFKVYCGEQQIRYSDVKLEDFVEFVRTQVMAFDAKDFNKIAYGAQHGESNDLAEIKQIVTGMAHAFAEREGASEEELNRLEEIADSGKAGEIAVRKALWKLYREYPSIARNELRPVWGLIGYALPATRLFQVATGVAKILLKASKASNEDDDTIAAPGKKAFDDTAIMPARGDLAKQYNSSLFDQLDKAGLPLTGFRHLGRAVSEAVASQNQSEQDKVINKIDRALNEDECLRLTRIMLQYFAIVGDVREALSPLITLAKDNIQDSFAKALTDSLLDMKHLAMKNDEEGRKYNGNEVTERINRVIRGEVPAAKMLALMIHCLYLQVES